MVKIAPSILSADFAKLGDEVEEVVKGGAEYVHFDVMDGMFVPNITIGVPVLKSLRKATAAFLDVHLMVEKPIRYVKAFCDAGADLVSFHVEADEEANILESIALAKSYGKKTGVCLSPATEADEVLPYLPYVDLVLLMTVEPGFGGQSFMHHVLPKIRRVRELIDVYNPACELEIDGGIDSKTAPLCKEAGASVLVAGSAVFGKEDRRAAIEAIRNA